MRPFLAVEDHRRLYRASFLALAILVAFTLLIFIAAASHAQGVAAVAPAPAAAGTLDLSVIVQAVLAMISMVATGLFGRWAPRFLDELASRRILVLTDQQRAAMLGAVRTAAGIIETKIDQGAVQVAHVQIDNPTVLSQARLAIAAVPTAAGALGMTEEGVARMIVGAIDTRTAAAPTPAAKPPAGA